MTMSQETFTPNQHISGISAFLDYGEQTFNPEDSSQPGGHKGYFSGPGWAARCTRHLKEHLSKPTEERLVEELRQLTDEQRCAIIHEFCRFCGSLDPRCCCWNDE